MPRAEPATPPLQALLDAFNAHDVDAIMGFFTEDCVFDTPRGPAPGGLRLVGKEQVRKGFQARFDGIPDVAQAAFLGLAELDSARDLAGMNIEARNDAAGEHGEERLSRVEVTSCGKGVARIPVGQASSLS